MTNQNTNNDILEMFEEWNQLNDILENIHLENTSTQDNDLLSNLTLQLESYENNIETLQEETTSNNENSDILSAFTQEEEIQEQPILAQMEEKVQKKVSAGRKIFSMFMFFTKYIATSSFIFAILIASTNYSAYIEIARSYLNPEALEQNKQAMLASVQNATIVKNDSQTWAETQDIQEEKLEVSNTTEKIEMVKNKTYHSMDKLVTSQNKDLDMNIEIVPYENRIVIPKIGKNIPLVDVQNKTVQNVKELENIFMKELVNGIVRYPGSARPGENGNSFIFWHSSNFPWLEWKYNDVFALMDNLTFGDEIIAYYWQKKYTYKIKEKKIIKPGDTSVLKRNNDISEITLMTCWPVGTTLNRMVVVWELIEE